MGFLRKVGKKIKKGVNKLFGSKFGKILGGIGLAMMFWGGANAMFGNTKWFQGLKTNISKMNPFAKPDLTSAVNEVGTATTETIVGTGAETVKSEALAGAAESVQAGLQVGKETTRALTDIPFSELDVGQKIAKAGAETLEFVTPSKDFAADVTKGTLTALAVGAAQGTPVDEGGYGAVQPNIGGAGEPSQAMLMAEVKNQMPQLASVNTFQDLNRQVLYGTLDPHFLANFS